MTTDGSGAPGSGDDQPVAADGAAPVPTIRVNTGYVLGQLARALTASRELSDAGARARAARKVEDWVRVFSGMLRGVLNVGSRVPVAGTPAWATLKVVTGGFATGELLADGPLQDHEQDLLVRLGRRDAAGAGDDSAARARLNAHFLTDEGMRELLDALNRGRYRVALPEEGALLAVAWLLARGGEVGAEQARAVLDEIGPYFSRLRFYPVPHPRPVEASGLVRVQDVSATVASLEAVRGRPVFERQREAARVWAPLYDRTVELFLETVENGSPRVSLDAAGDPLRRANGSYAIEGGWPCRRYPDGWAARARTLLAEYERARAAHPRCRTPERRNRSFGQLLDLLRRCADDPRSLTGRDVTNLRVMLAGSIHKRGLPGSPQLRHLRAEQQAHAVRPTTRELVAVLAERLRAYAPDGGLDSVERVLAPTSDDEVRRDVPTGYPFPPSVVIKVLRSWDAPPAALVERRVITSGEALARVLPQLTAPIRAAGITDPALRRLHGAIYAAFRRRRSLLLLDLQSQVKFEELPWVRPLDARRTEEALERGRAREVLEQVVGLTLRAFPQAIVPNKLVQEIRALAESAGLQVPLVEDVAADIFMGDFSEKFLRAAQRAAALLDGALYARYYDIPCERVRDIDDVVKSRYGAPTSPAFAALCRERAAQQAGGPGESGSERRSVAHNGTIVEQSQILTTHNLAVLFEGLGLVEALRPELDGLARECFTWLCRRLQFRSDEIWHAKLLALKNAAYAWRQMVFYLSFLSREEQAAFVEWAGAALSRHRPAFRTRFSPALEGLQRAVDGGAGRDVAETAASETGEAGRGSSPRVFLGWSTGTHWLLAAVQG